MFSGRRDLRFRYSLLISFGSPIFRADRAHSPARLVFCSRSNGRDAVVIEDLMRSPFAALISDLHSFVPLSGALPASAGIRIWS